MAHADNAPDDRRLASFAFEGFWPGFPADHGLNALTFAFTKTDPGTSRGTVTLRSADPLEPPDVNFRFFDGMGADRDLQALADAVGFVRAARGNVSAAAGLAPFEEIRPGNGNGDGDINEVKEFLALQAHSQHASGTCAIGADDDPLAVLDSRFRVRGVERLRVVDASVFPRPPGAFPVLPTFMVSRKAAGVILEDVWDDN